jgi:GH25 family lysozyme M1 (1,4-beta-N-acetylmuramidase)
MPFAPRVRRVASIAGVATVVAVPILLAAAPSSAAAKAPKGPDVSSYQHPNGKSINWKKVGKSGQKFAIVKATEGTSYVNPYFAKDYAAAGAAGLVRGSYHFARPAKPIVSTAQDQAKAFAKEVGTVTSTKTLPPALDLEVTGGLSSTQLVTWAQTFLLEMRHLTGRTPMLYTYPYFWDNDVNDPSAFKRFPLWMASYGSTAPTASLWQYTSNGTVKGIPDITDLSKYVGSSGPTWATIADGTVKTSWTPAAPAAPYDIFASGADKEASVSWRPGDAGTSRVLHYVVTSTPGNHTVTVPGSATSATVPGLSSSGSYTFTVKAINKVGSSRSSKASPVVKPMITTGFAVSAPTTLAFKSSMTLAATLTRHDTGAPLKNRAVTLYRRTSSAKPWTVARQLTTDSKGDLSVTLKPYRSTEYELYWHGSKYARPAVSYASVVVRPTVYAHLSADPVKKGHKATLYGEVKNFSPGQKVTREGYYSGAWHVWNSTTVDANGKYAFTFKVTVKTVDAFRVVAAAVHGRGAGISRTVRLTVD